MLRFQGSRDRIDRALVHAKAYATVASQLFENNRPTPSFDVKHDGANGGTGIARLVFEKPFDRSLALELGEFFYQLRAALDGAFWEASVLVCSPNKPPGIKRVEFPICSEERFKSSLLHKMPFPKELYDLIESVQPYNVHKYRGTPEGGFIAALELIHDCARLDRHRHLHVTAALPHKAAGRFTCSPQHRITSVEPLPANFLEGKCDFMRFGIEGWDGLDEPDITLEGHIDIHIAVQEIPVPLGGDVGEYLQMLHTVTAYMVAKFENAFR